MFLVYFPEVVKRREEVFEDGAELKSGESINKSRNTCEIGFQLFFSLSLASILNLIGLKLFY